MDDCQYPLHADCVIGADYVEVRTGMDGDVVRIPSGYRRRDNPFGRSVAARVLAADPFEDVRDADGSLVLTWPEGAPIPPPTSPPPPVRERDVWPWQRWTVEATCASVGVVCVVVAAITT